MIVGVWMLRHVVGVCENTRHDRRQGLQRVRGLLSVKKSGVSGSAEMQFDERCRTLTCRRRHCVAQVEFFNNGFSKNDVTVRSCSEKVV